MVPAPLIVNPVTLAAVVVIVTPLFMVYVLDELNVPVKVALLLESVNTTFEFTLAKIISEVDSRLVIIRLLVLSVIVLFLTYLAGSVKVSVPPVWVVIFK